MDKRTTGIIATIVTVLLCGCPGLIGVCFGALAAVVSFIPEAEIDMGGSSDPQAALIGGTAILCISMFLVMIPIVVGFFTLRRKPTDTYPGDLNQPVPPTS